MGVPVVLATFAACGSIVTSIKSSWELRRMIKRKQEAKECDEDAPYVFRRLRRAYCDGLMSTAEYELWYEKFLVAKVEKDLSAMRRIRAHVRILENGAPVAPNQRSRRRHSVSSGGSPRHVEFSEKKANLEYRPDRRARVGARPEQFVRFEREPKDSRSSSQVSIRGRSRSASVSQESRVRRERRHGSGDSEESSDYYSEKREHRGRSMHR